MDKPIDLVPLVCPKCNYALPADFDEVAWVCKQCSQGIYLDEETGLATLEVNYDAGILPNSLGKPFWVAEGMISVRRETYGASGKQNNEAELFWQKPRLFFIPAHTCSLEDLLSKATTLLLRPPILNSGPLAPFNPVTLPMSSIFPTAEFIVMAIEAGRKDKLKRALIDLKLDKPILWILP